MSEHTRTRLSFSAILEPQKLSIDVSEQRKKNAQSGRGKKQIPDRNALFGHQRQLEEVLEV